jgi:hypothetical protein
MSGGRKHHRFNWLQWTRRHEDEALTADAEFAEAFSELPAQEKSVLALAEIGGLQPGEIAHRLHTDVVVIDAMLARARRTMRAKLRAKRGWPSLVPLDGWLSSAGPGPSLAVRAAGAVAAAALGTGIVVAAVEDAAADPPQPVVHAERPVARALAVVPVSRAPARAAAHARGQERAEPTGAAVVRLPPARGHFVADPDEAPPGGTSPPQAPAHDPGGPEPAPPPAAAPEPELPPAGTAAVTTVADELPPALSPLVPELPPVAVVPVELAPVPPLPALTIEAGPTPAGPTPTVPTPAVPAVTVG